MKKIIAVYKQHEDSPGYHTPEFSSNASEFHVTLWNLNYRGQVNATTNRTSSSGDAGSERFVKEFVKEPAVFAKEFVKASRQIYRLISQDSRISAAQIATSLGLSTRQVQKYMKRLQDLNKISRVGGRKTGEWKISDEEYEGFFDRI